ncbi:glucose dehydrogenase [Candidatus Bathyarchaeota archaeon]|nr:MAG: glucose dehydrogenase [Candidatus Bathyarchaeota archaeon]
MKAIVVEPHKQNSVRLAEVDKPIPLENEVLLEPLCVGIDGTDREINEGVYGEPPEGADFLVLGHEAVAHVGDFGDKVQGFSRGDLVVPTVRRPGNCLSCRLGEISMCPQGDYSEHGILKLHGFASEYALSDANFLVKIPSELKDIAILLEPLSVAEKAVSQVFLAQQRMTWMPKRAIVLGAGPLGLLVTMLLRLRGLEVYCAATRPKESLKAELVQRVGATYVNTNETPPRLVPGKFDLIIEATGNVGVAIESFYLLNSSGVLGFLGVYRDKEACQDFGKVLTNMVLGNRLMFGSVSSDKRHFEMGLKSMIEIQHNYGDVLGRMINERLPLTNFKKAFSPEKEEIKTVICFR